MNKLIVTLILSLNVSLAYGESLLLSIGAVDEGTDSARIGHRLAKEISQRGGVDIILVPVPENRLITLLKSGRIDGDFTRIGEFQDAEPALIQVAEPIGSFSYFAYTMKDDIEIDDWNSLIDYRVAYIEGSKIMAKKLKPIHDNIFPVKNTEAGLHFLAAGRADIFVHIEFLVEPLLKEKEFRKMEIRALKPRLHYVQTYMHLLTKHAELAKKIDKTLREMKADKTYDKLLRTLD